MLRPAFITLPYGLERDPPPFEGNHVKYPESLVRYFLKAYTLRGQAVFDPFAGLGTTLFVAEEMKRVPYGVEADAQRYQWVAGQLQHWTHMEQGDSAKIGKIAAVKAWPKMDFCMTSPPFMPKHHQWNPLFAGNPARAGYAAYLKQMSFIFGQLAGIMKRNATIVVQCDNLHGKQHYTPLVRDLSVAISKVLHLQSEIIVAWTDAKKDYLHTHCLVFRNR